MACQFALSTSEESQKIITKDFELLSKSLKNKSINDLSLPCSTLPEEDNLVNLPRGGVIIKTKIGNIQYGMPPETVKDSLKLGIKVPTYFIIPTNRFDRKSGINVAEFEFPAYFNFFCNLKQICLICNKEAEAAVRIIFQETLIGPLSHENLQSDFFYKVPASSYPDFIHERFIFSANPLKPSEDINIETLLRFKVFDEETGCVEIEENNCKIKIVSKPDCFEIIQDDIPIATIPDKIDLYDTSTTLSLQNLDKNAKKSSCSCCTSFNAMTDSQQDFSALISSPTGLNKRPLKVKFIPPDFGVTILGSSHGFDPNGSTSGFIVWIFGRGIMVDPPPFTNDYMRNLGINYSLINGVIISHCHADHDAGAFHQIVAEQKIEVITTRTIMNSFLKKYSALSQISQEELKRLFIFRPVIIGTSLKMYGGIFSFFYAFHTIPTLGFTIEVQGKKMYFSGDTFYSPTQTKKLAEQGRVSQARCDQLSNIDFSQFDLILHEAGVPPIHTPQAELAAFSPEIKQKLYVVHIAQKDLLPNSGLKIPELGFENTIVLQQTFENQEIHVMKRLDILSNIDLFEDFSIKHVKHLMDAVCVQNFSKGELLFQEGDRGNTFYIIQQGTIRIYSHNRTQIDKLFSEGEYFGEISLIDPNCTRVANAEAFTDCQLLTLEKHDFNFLFGDQSDGKGIIMQKLKQLTKARRSLAGEFIEKNSILKELEQSQKTQLEMIMKEASFEEQTIIWKQGENPKYALIIKEGEVVLIKKQENSSILQDDEELIKACCKSSYSHLTCKTRDYSNFAIHPEKCSTKEIDEEAAKQEKEGYPIKIYLTTGAFICDTNSVCQGQTHSNSLVCKTPVKAFTISNEDLTRFFTVNPGFKLIVDTKEYFD